MLVIIMLYRCLLSPLSVSSDNLEGGSVLYAALVVDKLFVECFNGVLVS